MRLKKLATIFMAVLAGSLVVGASDEASSSASSSASATNPPPSEPASGVQGFVVRNGSSLQLNGRKYTIAGANFYPALINAADSGGTGRKNITAVFKAMQGMGMNVLRTWAFNEGPPGSYKAVQIAPGQLDETVLSEGLDWLVAEAPKYGIRLLLALTNGAIGYGGMYQYVKWAKLSTVEDFYTSPQINKWYQDYARAIVTRKNTITGVPYANDPAIIGWELANEAWNPGDASGNVLQDWYQNQATFVKSLAPAQLLSLGGRGKFGGSTPSLLPSNPLRDNVFGAAKNNGGPFPEASICFGEDFSRNNKIPEVDLASLHLYPDLSFVCSLDCKLEWTRSNLLDHVTEATRLQKPLLVGEFNLIPLNGLAERNTFLSQIYGDLQSAAAQGKAIAGTLIWALGVSASVPGYSGWNAFNIYSSAEPYAVLAGVPGQQQPQAFPILTSIAMEAAQTEEFIFNNGSDLACSARLADGAGQVNTFTGWEETLAIMTKNAASVAA